MRSHSLKDLQIPGGEAALRAFPGFDFYNLGRVKRLKVVAEERGDVTLKLECVYSNPGNGSGTVRICFRGVRSMKLPDFLPQAFLSEIEIDDVSHDQLEGIRYIAKSYGGGQLEVYCEEIAIDSCRPD